MGGFKPQARAGYRHFQTAKTRNVPIFKLTHEVRNSKTDIEIFNCPHGSWLDEENKV